MGVSLADTDLDDDADFAETHDINVTPFIDVILVLLIIFMVAAPLSTVDLPIDLPSSTATPQKKRTSRLTSASSRTCRWRSARSPSRRAELISTLNAAAKSNPERLVFVRADRGVAYGDLMDVLELLRQGNYRMKLVALEGVADASTPSQAGAARP